MISANPFPGFSLRTKTGTFDLQSGPFTLKNGRVCAVADGKEEEIQNWTAVPSEPGTFTAKSRIGKWILTAVCKGEQIVLTLSLKRKKKVAKLEIFYFKDAKITLPDHLLCRAMGMGGNCAILTDKVAEPVDFQGMIAVLTSGKEQLTLSSPMHPEHFLRLSGRIQGKKQKSMTMSAKSEITGYSPEDIHISPLTFALGDAEAFMQVYGKENTEEQKNFQTSFAPGWNSWDYYRWIITEDAVLENAEWIASDPVLSRYVKKIIVDDGWQYAYGEWEANSLFPSGMESLAKNLKKMGFTPGLWLCPAIVEPFARIAQWDYDMLALSEDGHPALLFECMKRYGFVMDPTLEKSQKFWYDLFRKYVDLGYGYFKLDFNWAVMEVPRYHDTTVPRGHLLDPLFRSVRSAVGNRAEIMACGYPIACGNRYIDAVRVGGDIHAIWSCVKHNTPSVASIGWANHQQWVNDPDFAVCRGPETSDDPDLNRLRPCLVYNQRGTGNIPSWSTWSMGECTRTEAEVLLSVAIAAGGARNLSDRMPRLNQIGIDMARRTVAAEPGEAAVPLDLYRSECPSYWLQKVGKNFRALIVNWTDEPQNFVMDLAAQGVPATKGTDFWRDTPVAIRNGRIETELEPHSCLFAHLS